MTGNFALNPSFEGVAGSWEVARNYHVNPGAVSTSGFGFFSGGGNTASMSVVAAGWSLSGSAARVTWTAVGASEGDINAVVGPIAGVGTVVTVVFRWVASRSGMVMGAPGAYDENVGYIATTARSRSVSLTATAGEVVEDWVTFVIPQWATADLQLYVNIIGKQAGDSVDMSMADAYLGEYQPDRGWFSGGFSPDSDLTPSWTGSANASASVLRATGVSGVAASDASRGWNIASSQWASSGVRSVRNYRPAPGLTDSFIRMPNDWFPGFAPGKVYGVKAKIRLEKPLSGSIIGPGQQPTRLRRFMAVFGGVGEFGSPDQYPNEAGVHEIKWVFTVPESATGLTAFRVYSGHSFGDFWVDDFMVVTAETEAEAQAMLADTFLWGDSPTETRPDGYTRRSWWEGTPNNSVSVRGEWEPGVLSGWIAAHTGMPSLRVTVPGPVYAGDRLLVNPSQLPMLVSDPLAPPGVPTVYRQGEHHVTLVRPTGVNGGAFVTNQHGRGINGLILEPTTDNLSWTSTITRFNRSVHGWGKETKGKTGSYKLVLLDPFQENEMWNLLQQHTRHIVSPSHPTFGIPLRVVTIDSVSRDLGWRGMPLPVFTIGWTEATIEGPNAPVVTWGEYEAHSQGWTEESYEDLCRRIAGMP